MANQRPRIEPRTLRGFTDLLPELATRQRELVHVAEHVFASFGYEPIVTPALEYVEILKSKGGEESDKQMFEFDDQGGRRIALRFDLTVPLARFAAQHNNELYSPCRLYNIGQVWRGERPQRGRFREFLQCDADIIGETDVAADAEIITMLQATMRQMDIGSFTIRVNNRRILNGLLGDLGMGDRVVPVLRALDKLDKIGEDGVRAELAMADVTGTPADQVLEFVSLRQQDDAATLDAVAKTLRAGSAAEQGLQEVRALLDLMSAAGADRAAIAFDPSIARGLDYYTGTVFETTLGAAPHVGSICSGGRYDDLAGLFTTARLPGVGGSIGVSRILAALADPAGEARQSRRSLVVITRHEENLAETLAMAADLRVRTDSAVEVYPSPAKHATQMKYADARGARFVLTIDADGSVSVKDMVSGDRHTCAQDAAAIADQLAKLT